MRGYLPGRLHSSQEGRSRLRERDYDLHDPVACIDCGACVPVCPVSAIFALDDLPEKWADFTAVNAKYFKPDPVS